MQSQLSQLALDERSYRFFPTHDEQKYNFNKPNGSRVYFHGQIQHDEFEKKKLLQFQDYLKNKVNNQYDHSYYNTHMLVLFLSCHHYKPQQTYQAMKQHIAFKNQYIRNDKGELIITLQKDKKVQQIVKAGFFYVCGRDKQFRPTMVCNLKKANFDDADSILRAVVFVQEAVIQKLFIPGQVQQWNIIYDLGGMGITDIPINALKSTIKIISDNYGGKLYKFWMVNAPSTIYFSWKVVKNFLDPVTVQKITIAKKNTDDTIWKIYDKSQIQQKYGGNQANRTVFYPFKIPKAVVDQSRLITQHKYAQLLQTGYLKNNIINPKYLNTKTQPATKSQPASQSANTLSAEQSMLKNLKIWDEQPSSSSSQKKNILAKQQKQID